MWCGEGMFSGTFGMWFVAHCDAATVESMGRTSRANQSLADGGGGGGGVLVDVSVRGGITSGC